MAVGAVVAFPQPNPRRYRGTCPPCHPSCHPISRRGDRLSDLADPSEALAATVRPHTWADCRTLVHRTAAKDPEPEVGSHTRLRMVWRYARLEGAVRAGGSRLTRGDFWLCLRRTKRVAYRITHEVRFTKYKENWASGHTWCRTPKPNLEAMRGYQGSVGLTWSPS